MSKDEKDKVIRQVYYDADTGFGSIAETFKDAKKVLNSITYNDVKEFLERQKSRQTKPYRGFNSYVAHEPLQEIQIDIADVTCSVKERTMVTDIVLSLWMFSQSSAMRCRLKIRNVSNPYGR